MTPKEKAEYIIDKCYEVEVESVYFGVNHYLSKKFGLIVVNEIIEALHENHWQNRLIIDYYEEVKQEIEKL
jgi:hypothetical protein